MNLRVVFDTDVLFSAVGWAGTPGRCVELSRTGQIAGITCVEILDELAEKLSAKLGLDNDQVDAVLGSLMTLFELVPITGEMTELQNDPKDNKVLECAVAGRATHIVTGDLKHLVSMRNYKDILIITPADLMRLVEVK